MYCSKDATSKHSIVNSFEGDAGNIWFERLEHTWVQGKCKFCGASKTALGREAGLETHAYAFIHTHDIKTRIAELFGETCNSTSSSATRPTSSTTAALAPAQRLFTTSSSSKRRSSDPRLLTMVIPSRWFAGGKGLDDFREAMLKDDRLRSIDDYLSAADVFPGVGLKGGICYFLWDRDDPGPCLVTTHFKDWAPSTASRPLLEDGLDVFIRFNEGLSILKKVVAVETGQNASLSLPEGKRFDRLVSSRKPFGLDTTFKGKRGQGAPATCWSTRTAARDTPQGARSRPAFTSSTSGRFTLATPLLGPATRTRTRTESSARRSSGSLGRSHRRPISASGRSIQSATLRAPCPTSRVG